MIINLGDSPFKAYVKVTYPKGTCTCTMGSTTYSHSGGGTAIFKVNKKGAWTITVSYNGLSKSSTATVNDYNGTVSLSLSPATWFYDEGNECSSVTNGWDQPGDLYYTVGASGVVKNNATVTKNSGNIYVSAGSDIKLAAAMTLNKVSFSGVRTLYFRNTSTGSGNAFAVMSSRSGNMRSYTNASVTIPAGTDKVTTLDVTNILSGYLAIISEGVGTITGLEIYGA